MTLKKVAHTNLSHDLLASMARTALSNTVSLENDLNAKRLREAVAAALPEFDAAILRDRTSAFTQKINELDFQRDELIVAIRAHVTAAIAQYMIDQTIADQAKVVKKVVDTMDPKVTTLGYLEESAQIKRFLSSAEAIAGAIEESKSTPLISALDTVQKKFDLQLDTKLKSGEFDDAPRRLKTVRAELVAAVTNLFDYIRTVAGFNPTQYQSVITALNALADNFAAQAAAEKTREETAKKAAGMAS